MIIFDGIRNEELSEAIRGFRRLRKEYQGERDRLSKKYRRGIVPEKERMGLEDEIFSPENFDKILPEDAIISIRLDMTTEMTAAENTLYSLNQAILRRLDSDYSIYFLYTGRCASCGSETERKIPVESPVTDSRFIDNAVYKDAFSDHLACHCGEETYPVKTANLFELEGDNDYNVMLTSARKKSEGRIIPKFVEKCSGKRKDIRDIHGLKLICKAEEDCKDVPEMLIKYNGDSRIKCRDYFENAKYFFYIDKKGRPRKQYIDEPLETQARRGFDAKGHPIHTMYKAIHVPIEFKGTLVEVQIKDAQQHQKEHDPNSPLFHRSYASGKSVHHEEYKELEIKAGWGEFEKRLERFLYDTGLFADFNPRIYGR